MAKAPEPGRVKTRLRPLLGDSGAAALASAFLEDTWAAMAKVPGLSAKLVLDGEGPLPSLRPEPDIWRQGTGDLGARLEEALSRALRSAPFAIAVGTDSPGLPGARVQEAGALLELEKADAVIGPTPDGGYYLLGLARCPEGLLAGLPWSSAMTRAATEERLRERGMAIAHLEEWFDVDEPGDLERLRELLRADPARAPRTAALLLP